MKEEQEMLKMLESNSLEDIVEIEAEEERWRIICEEADRKTKAEENTVYIIDSDDNESFTPIPRNADYPYLDRDGFIVLDN